MIKLERTFTPLCLSPSEVIRLTGIFRANVDAVWNIGALKAALLETSFNKCAYCECNLKQESKYMEVDHFRDKDRYPDDVVKWSNLIPSCKRCNGAKHSHDVVAEPIIDPYQIDPRDHIAFKLYRFRSKSLLGQVTLDVLDLNDFERAVNVRFQIGEEIQSFVLEATVKLERYRASASARNRNSLRSHMRGLLQECVRPASYAATSATVLHNEGEYLQLRQNMRGLQLWDDDLEALHLASASIALDYV